MCTKVHLGPFIIKLVTGLTNCYLKYTASISSCMPFSCIFFYLRYVSVNKDTNNTPPYIIPICVLSTPTESIFGKVMLSKNTDQASCASHVIGRIPK